MKAFKILALLFVSSAFAIPAQDPAAEDDTSPLNKVPPGHCHKDGTKCSTPKQCCGGFCYPTGDPDDPAGAKPICRSEKAAGAGS
ncbi:unnamed protein product [Zymoseptoria tritici ST99CH_3D1]|uniref:WAP domain-containing protein n=2 Tax=Zymoseptoria tritici TaxID=1047171 RepID=A0A1X7S6R8_ZYMT9|nr:unnamed protein product [Zymoseptoria tritici ST99CH_3D7]SMR60542.1 unnamed protein product [Zymoseptoria tritici ST99CH_1E4]SMR63655.1 unnamed protein product [Zymoseptoria tritici ST99CH_3D1]